MRSVEIYKQVLIHHFFGGTGEKLGTEHSGKRKLKSGTFQVKK